MAVTATDIKTRFPEFINAGDTLIDAKIAEAEAMTNATEWGSAYDVALGYQVAHLLSLTPFGIDNRLSRDSAETVYSRFLDGFKKQRANPRTALAFDPWSF